MHIFSGQYKSRKLLAPKGDKTRPTSGRLREALFNICHSSLEGSLFLDLFAGSGAMGFEALSRGAKHATFVDNSRESVSCIQSNMTALGLGPNCDVIYGDVFDSMKKLTKKGKSFDLIYADPPYDAMIEGIEGKNSLSTQVLKVLDDLIELKLPLLKPEGSLFLEDALDSIPEAKAYKHLELKDNRSMGRSALQRWGYKNS